ncbi:hypothetical protein CRUP_019230 [Coryphaenoides rupestris]|nr:hypothetical protein CRUP_019230 [Coryphaenoides rupestris]
MTADNEIEMKEIFTRAQKGHNNKAKLLEDKTLFHDEFIHYLKYAMVVYKREPAVENVIEFVAKFASSFQTPSKSDKEGEKETGEEEEDDDDDDEEDHPFLNFIFNFLLESHKANSHAVRFRVCQLINRLLGSMAENAQIDDDLFDNIHQAMLVRVTDKFPNNDSNAEVRRAVLSCIAMSPSTLPKVLKRTRDIKETVRKLAYQVLADKVHIKALSIAQRVDLLQHGLHDSSEAVREAARSRLLPSWLKRLEGDVVELLHRLDVENCSETALDALKALFAAMPDDQLLQDRVLLCPSKLIPGDSLSCENVLYWRALCEFLKARGDEGEEMLDRILPDAASYADYLYGFVKTVPVLSEEQRADFATLELVMTKEFISVQLILLTGCLDTHEEGGRKRVLAVLQEMLCLPQTPPSLVSLLTEKLLSLIPDDNRRIQTVAEIISDVREPIMEASQPVDEDEKRRQQIKLAEVKVRILEAKQALDDCIAAQEFSHAARFKDSITELENERGLLLQDSSQPADRESDPDTLLRCLTMCAELLKQMNIKTRIGPTLSAIMSSLILPCIANAHTAVRNMSVLCLGTCALHCKELAKTHLLLLLQIAQLDEVKIRISALRSIVDLLLLYGFQLLSDRAATRAAPAASGSPGGQQEEEEGEGPAEEKGDTAGGHGAEHPGDAVGVPRWRVPRCSPALVLLWYNPVTEDDTRLRHCLGVFFQLYARESRAHQEVVGECFLPTVRTLMNAPATSPLAEKKAPTGKGGRKASRRAESSEESDGENVPESIPVARPSRRAKTAAMEKTKLDLNPLIDQEANTS